MLQVTIKDIKTNEVIYDEQVCMIIMQAIEEKGVRSLRQTSEEADLSDVVACFEAVRQASVDANNVLLKSLNYAMKRACPEEGDADGK